MDNDSLTAEERERLENLRCSYPTDTARVAKLLRLYDAALARAEAAERDAWTHQQHAAEAVFHISPESFYAEVGARKDAESRLAEVTALLERHGRRVWMARDMKPETIRAEEALDIETTCFLSGSTPAQAAEPALPCLSGTCAEYGMCPEHAGPAGCDGTDAEGFPGGDARFSPAPAESDGDDWRRGVESTRADLATARARIAELEARYDAVLKDLIHEGDASAAQQTSIAKAVAVLEKDLADTIPALSYAKQAEKRALKILKGNV